MDTAYRGNVEIWGGIECTVNRVGDKYYDQLKVSGHERRGQDLHLIADLGVKALRYPLVWERFHPQAGADFDWTWGDERLGILQQREIRPILGLVHHGSGPADTNLLDGAFAPGLARYATAVAQRYPWVDAYTPVNEPLTTARFSALYGHWYPHARDACSCWEALLNECEATVLAMRSIRKVNPSAKLIQTEDIGKTHSTPELTYQAEFENERRWVTWDLLSGRLDRDNAMWAHLLWCGVSEDRLAWFLDNTCPPDIIGINYYVTSERYLDQRLERYPKNTHGGNGRSQYADVEAVRALPAGIAGVRGIIREAWDRYRQPLAITEVHLGCTREEQMRWLVEEWTAAQESRLEGINVEAITAWSLLGAYDWDSLLTRWRGSYEPGAFDLRSPTPRPTALARTVKALSSGKKPSHPVLSSPGWWRRDTRLLYPGVYGPAPAACSPGENGRGCAALEPRRQRVLITGGRGVLAQAFARICEIRGLDYRLLTRQELDIADAAQVEATIRSERPWAVVNAAGFADVDRAEVERELSRRANRLGPCVLANVCRREDVCLLTFSTALVFDGQRSAPYTEFDDTFPLNTYGRDKAAAEREILQTYPAALVVRAGAFFGPWDERNFVARSLAAANSGQVVRAPRDAVISPTYLPDLVHASLDLLIDGEHGLWHLANRDAVTWAELARSAFVAAGCDDCLSECMTSELGLAAQRPANCALSSSRSGPLLPGLDDALQRFAEERRHLTVC